MSFIYKISQTDCLHTMNVKKMSFICKIWPPVYLHTFNVNKISVVCKIWPPVYLHTFNVKKMLFISKFSQLVCFHTVHVKKMSYICNIFGQLFICIPWMLVLRKMSFISKILLPVYLPFMEIGCKKDVVCH